MEAGHHSFYLFCEYLVLLFITRNAGYKYSRLCRDNSFFEIFYVAHNASLDAGDLKVHSLLFLFRCSYSGPQNTKYILHATLKMPANRPRYISQLRCVTRAKCFVHCSCYMAILSTWYNPHTGITAVTERTRPLFVKCVLPDLKNLIYIYVKRTKNNMWSYECKMDLAKSALLIS